MISYYPLCLFRSKCKTWFFIFYLNNSTKMYKLLNTMVFFSVLWNPPDCICNNETQLLVQMRAIDYKNNVTFTTTLYDTLYLSKYQVCLLYFVFESLHKRVFSTQPLWIKQKKRRSRRGKNKKMIKWNAQVLLWSILNLYAKWKLYNDGDVLFLAC